MQGNITTGIKNTALYLPISGKTDHLTHHIVCVPASLGKLVEQAYEAGEFKCFGDKKLIQLRAKEGVLWLLATLYNRTIKRGEEIDTPVPLPNEAMEERFGKGKAVNWYTLIKFCQHPKRDFIQDDGYYIPGVRSKHYWLNPDKITGPDEYYYRLQQPIIINKRLGEIKRFEEEQKALQAQRGIAREIGKDITLTNLEHLVFDSLELDKICRLRLNISLDELTDWAWNVKYNPGNYFKVSFAPYNGTALNIEGKEKGKSGLEEESEEEEMGKGRVLVIHHSVPPFYISGKQKKKGTFSEQEKEVSRQRQLLNSLTTLLLGVDEKYVFADDQGGRLYSPVTNLKREARAALRFKNDAGKMDMLVNLDVKSCQPWLLGMAILKNYQELGVAAPGDVLEYLQLIEEADFYNAIVDYAGYEPTPESRDKIKKSVMKDFYRSKYINKESTIVSDVPQNEAGKFVAQKFPNVWKWLIENKGDGIKSRVPVMMQKLEADYFIDKVLIELRAKGIWCLTIHDSVLVRADDAYYVEQYLRKSMEEFFGRHPKICKEVFCVLAENKKAAA